MAKYTLHLSKGTVALAVHIALNEVGADYTLAWVDFPSGAQTKPDYLALNPKGRVPCFSRPPPISTTPIKCAATAGRMTPALTPP